MVVVLHYLIHLILSTVKRQNLYTQLCEAETRMSGTTITFRKAKITSSLSKSGIKGVLIRTNTMVGKIKLWHHSLFIKKLSGYGGIIGYV